MRLPDTPAARSELNLASRQVRQRRLCWLRERGKRSGSRAEDRPHRRHSRSLPDTGPKSQSHCLNARSPTRLAGIADYRGRVLVVMRWAARQIPAALPWSDAAPRAPCGEPSIGLLIWDRRKTADRARTRTVRPDWGNPDIFACAQSTAAVVRARTILTTVSSETLNSPIQVAGGAEDTRSRATGMSQDFLARVACRKKETLVVVTV